MINKLILIGSLGLSIQLHADIDFSNKDVIKAGKPTIYQASQSTSNQLVLAVGSFDPLYETLDFNQSKLAAKETSSYTIIQFEDGKADSSWLRKNGIQVVSYLPNNAFVVVSDRKIDSLLNSKNDIRWAGNYLSSYKVSPSLWPNNLKNLKKYDLAVSIFKNVKQDSIPLIFRKFLPNTQIELKYLGANNLIKLTVDSKNLSQVLNKLAAIDAVQYVEPALPMKLFNTEAVSAIQDNADPDSGPADDRYRPSNTPIWDKGLIGSGQIVGVADTGLDTNEDWFVHYDNGTTITSVVTEAEDTSPPIIGTLYPNNKVIGNFIMPGAEAYDHALAGFHGTHVTGSIAGDREQGFTGIPGSGSISSPTSSGYDNDDGMAPNAQILFQDIGGFTEDEDGNTIVALTGQGSSPMWEQAYNAGARIHSNSYGSDTEGAYTLGDFRVDGTLRTFEDMLILFAAGNDGASINSVGSPAVAKNVLTVGALANGNSPFETNFSNRGPTDDGRIKPDIMATGARIESAGGNEINTTEITPPSTASLSGTSMATPITAGAAAMMRQYYTDGFYPTGVANPADSHIPTGPLMKATLINGAGIDGGHFDKDIGWGRVFLSNSIMFDDSDKQLRVWEMVNANGLKTGESTEIKLGVKPDQPLAITLAWYDVPAAFGASKALINDIDLEVEFNGQIYKGNVFSDIAVSGTGGQRDSINTVEQVRIPNPVEGIYTITIKGTNVPGDETVNSFRQGFGLVATGNFDNIDSNPAELTEISSLNSTILGGNGVLLEWSGGGNADYYEVYRVQGSCANADFKKLRFVGQSDNSTYTDFRTSNGVQYAYKIRAGQFRGLGNLSSACVDITSTQACDFLPSFSQRSVQITDNVSDICRTELQWSQGSSNCPSSPNIRYNIYRSTDRDFMPSSQNLITTVTSTNYNDIRAPNEAAYYIVRAEDNSLTGTGPNGGTETTGTLRLRSQAVGNGFTSGPLLEDVDNVAIMNFSFPWQVVSNKAADGILSYKTGVANGNYPHDECSSMVSNTISLPSDEPNPTISYKALYDLEENWDGVVVEISVDNGATWVDLPPDGGYPGDFSETTANPVNACGYASTQGAFSGTNNDVFESFSHDLSDFVGSDVKIRWRLSTDPGVEMEGFYLDSIQYPNIQAPNACTVNTAPDRPQQGLYYDRGRNGHGFVIEPIANTDLYFTVFYTYKDDGTPEWYTSLSTLENNVLNFAMDDNTLLRVTHDFTVDATGAGNPNTIDTSIGTNILRIDFNKDIAQSSDACNDGITNRGEDLAVASWQLGSQQGDWCIEPLIAQDSYPTPDFGGIWWTGADDDGWGFSLSFAGDLIVVAMYYFDASGQARWALGQQSGFQAGQEITINMDEFNGYARTATPTELVSSNAGSMTLTLNNNSGNGNDGTMSVNVTYQGSEGGTWSRTNVPVTIFTEPH